MGRTPEIIIAMLACARIGAIHSVVYGGFSVESLAERIEDSNSHVLIVSDGAYQRGKVVPLKKLPMKLFKDAVLSNMWLLLNVLVWKLIWNSDAICGTMN